jgi:hypothetical protein
LDEIGELVTARPPETDGPHREGECHEHLQCFLASRSGWSDCRRRPRCGGAFDFRRRIRHHVGRRLLHAAKNEITLEIDPCCHQTNGNGSINPANYNVDEFQLSVNYNCKDLTLVSTSFVSPYKTMSLSCMSSSTPGDSEVAGVASSPDATKPGDVDLFYETFQLKAGVSPTTALTFTVGADSDSDYIYAVPTSNPNDKCDGITARGPGEIQSSTVTASISPAPLPPAYAAGGATLLVALAAGFVGRAKRQTA